MCSKYKSERCLYKEFEKYNVKILKVICVQNLRVICVQNFEDV